MRVPASLERWQNDRDLFAHLARLRERYYSLTSQALERAVIEQINDVEIALGLKPTNFSTAAFYNTRPKPGDRVAQGLCIRCGEEPLATETLGGNCRKYVAEWARRKNL